MYMCNDASVNKRTHAESKGHTSREQSAPVNPLKQTQYIPGFTHLPC